MKSKVFFKGKMFLKVVDHVRRNLLGPSKLAPSWKGPYLIREANDSSYYRLAIVEDDSFVEPINGKWLKLYCA